MKAIFGGSETKQQSTSTPVDMTPDAFKALRGQFADQLNLLMSSGKAPGGDYEGELVAPWTAGEQAMLEKLRTEGGTRNALLEDTMSGKYLPGQEGANPHLEAAIREAQRPTLQGL